MRLSRRPSSPAAGDGIAELFYHSLASQYKSDSPPTRTMVVAIVDADDAERGRAADDDALDVAVAAAADDLLFWICEMHPEWSSFGRSIASRDGASHYSISVSGRRFSTAFVARESSTFCGSDLYSFWTDFHMRSGSPS